MKSVYGALLGVSLVSAVAAAQVRSGMMDIGDASLRYELSGAGGHVVVLVHGWALTQDIWDDQVAALSPSYRVLRYDMRGFGKSTGNADRSAEPDDLRILLDSLGIQTPVHLVGLSRGANVVADFAARWPHRVRSLVLYGFGPTPDFPIARGAGRPPFRAIARSHGVDSLKRFIANSPLGWRPAGAPTPAMLRLDTLMMSYDARDLLHDAAPANRVAEATLGELSRLRVPVLLLHGDHEMPLLKAVADSLARRQPGARKVVIANAGHGAHFHQPEMFNREVLAFLRQVDVLPASPRDAGPARAQHPLQRMPEVRRLINAREGAAALRLLDTLAAQVPAHPNVPFLRAHAYGVMGRLDEAAREIGTLLRVDARYARLALRDSSVASLRPRFPTVDSLADLAGRPVNTAWLWATIAERDLIAEGTAYDPATQSVLVGSLNRNRIVAIAPDGKVTDRVAAGAGGLHSVVGIHVDSARGILWAASNARFDTPSDSTPSALFAFDARTGAFRARLGVPAASAHFLNDVTTSPNGTVYVTDSRAGRVYFASPGAAELRELTALGSMISPNGITISSDGRVLFVTDADHIRAHDLQRGANWRLTAPDSIGVSGIDGLAFVDGALIAHHPLTFWRIARYELDPTRRRIVRRTLIEANTPDGRTSTTGEVVGSDYVFIGNSQIDRMNARTIDAATMDEIRMYRARIRPH